MQAIDLLLTRQSHTKLIAPAPSKEQLEILFQAALRAPDHGHLTPWHFVIVENEGLNRLSQLFADCVPITDTEKQKKAASLPFRAPMIITVIAKIIEHPKVPHWEQVVAAGCAVHAMQMAAFSLGFGGIWRSGEWCEHPSVRAKFECQPLDQIVGFLYLGTPDCILPKVPVVNTKPFISYF